MLTEDQELKLMELSVKFHNNLEGGLRAAFEEGLLAGAMRAAQTLGQQQNSGDDEDDDRAPVKPMSVADRNAIRGLGLDPDRKYKHKNSTLTIVGFKESRWKFPISVTNQNGRRLKTSAAFLLQSCRMV